MRISNISTKQEETTFGGYITGTVIIACGSKTGQSSR